MEINLENKKPLTPIRVMNNVDMNSKVSVNNVSIVSHSAIMDSIPNE